MLIRGQHRDCAGRSSALLQQMEEIDLPAPERKEDTSHKENPTGMNHNNTTINSLSYAVTSPNHPTIKSPNLLPATHLLGYNGTSPCHAYRTIQATKGDDLSSLIHS